MQEFNTNRNEEMKKPKQNPREKRSNKTILEYKFFLK